MARPENKFAKHLKMRAQLAYLHNLLLFESEIGEDLIGPVSFFLG